MATGPGMFALAPVAESFGRYLLKLLAPPKSDLGGYNWPIENHGITFKYYKALYLVRRCKVMDGLKKVTYGLPLPRGLGSPSGDGEQVRMEERQTHGSRSEISLSGAVQG